MNFAFNQEEDDLRAEVQDFIKARLNDDLLRELKEARRSGAVGPLAEAFFSDALAAGYTGISWPVEFGGRARSQMAHFIVEEEFVRAMDVRIGGGGSGAPAILASGTQEQKDFFIPAVMKREVVFAQGYSEPQCGTDLAGIKCRAIRQGDKYVINGQKTFVTDAHIATHIYLMVRTDPKSRRHRGLSILLVPMDTPGIAVRPLWTIQNNPEAPPRTTYGEPRVNEVFRGCRGASLLSAWAGGRRLGDGRARS